MMDRHARGPWYGFLYRALGAHGTFWLWVLSVVAMWWTWQGALLRVLDQKPERRSVAEVAQGSDRHRWVSVEGVEVWLDATLLARKDSSTTAVPILIDPSDPAARFWHRAALYAGVDAGLRAPGLEPVAAALGGLSLVAPAALRAHANALDVHVKLSEWRESLQKDATACLPRPRAAILLLRGSSDGSLPSAAIGSALAPGATLSPPTPPTSRPSVGESEPGDALEAYDRSVRDWGDAVRERVKLDAPTGLLDPTPQSLLDRIEKDPGVRLGLQALQRDRKPRDVELYVFCAAFLLMAFLAAGLYGVGRRTKTT